MTQKQPRKTSPLKQVVGGFGLLAGATYPLRSLALLIGTPRLLNYVWIPILLNIVTGIALYTGLLFPGLEGIDELVGALSAWSDNLIANLPTWLGFLTVIDLILGWVLRVVLVIGLFVAIGFLLVQFGGILGAPWYGQLSEQLELLRTGEIAKVEGGPGAALVDIWRAILFEVKKLVLALGVGWTLLLLNFFLPGIGTAIASIGGIALAATTVCLDFLDGPLERRRLRFRAKLRVILRSLPASASFGLVCLTLVSVPILNLLAIPICVASGTLFVCDRVLPHLSAPAPPAK
ncbi:MAG: hypothetical protein F6J93_19045 [Oscillatoria sp. SIO1A7]|nr:hypothetical protein [Oscillatoria sp. SIO1A7]